MMVLEFRSKRVFGLQYTGEGGRERTFSFCSAKLGVSRCFSLSLYLLLLLGKKNPIGKRVLLERWREKLHVYIPNCYSEFLKCPSLV
jgi:hypothetical protein